MKSFAIELPDEMVKTIKELWEIESDTELKDFLQIAVVKGILCYVLNEGLAHKEQDNDKASKV